MGVINYGTYVTYTSIAYIIGNAANLNSESINTANLINDSKQSHLHENFILPIQIKIATSIICVAGWCTYGVINFTELSEILFFIFCCHPIFTRNLNINYAIIALQKFAIQFYGYILEKLILLFGLIIVSKLIESIVIIPITYMIAVFINTLFVIFMIQKQTIRGLSCLVTQYDLKSYLKYLNKLKFSFLSKLTQPQTHLFKPICSVLVGLEAVAIYDILERITNLSKIFSTIIYQNFLPKIAKNTFSFYKLAAVVCGANLIFSVILYSFSSEIWAYLTGSTGLGNIRDEEIKNLLLVLMASALVMSFNLVIGNGYLLIRNYGSKYYRYIFYLNIVFLVYLIIANDLIKSLSHLISCMLIIEIAIAVYCAFNAYILARRERL